MITRENIKLDYDQTGITGFLINCVEEKTEEFAAYVPLISEYIKLICNGKYWGMMAALPRNREIITDDVVNFINTVMMDCLERNFCSICCVAVERDRQ